MTRFSNLNAIRRPGSPAPVHEAVLGDRWSPVSLVDDSALTKFRISRLAEKIIPSISARAMRLSLYRSLAASGAKGFDSISVSVEWTAALVAYSAFNAFFPSGFERGMNLFSGYPRIVNYDSEDKAGVPFRIYARTAGTADDIVRSAMLLASHRGYITGQGSALDHHVDLTGVFITRPGVAPKRVGISGYEHWVDFELNPAVPLLKFDSEPAWLIPGPPRLSREETGHALRVISGESAPSPEIEDTVELISTYPDGPPRFEIPIRVKGQGRLDSTSCWNAGAAGIESGGSMLALGRAGLPMAMVAHPLIPMRLPAFPR